MRSTLENEVGYNEVMKDVLSDFIPSYEGGLPVTKQQAQEYIELLKNASPQIDNCDEVLE